MPRRPASDDVKVNMLGWLWYPLGSVQASQITDITEKDVRFQLTCKLCPESHTTQVWLCVLVLSFLSACTCASSVIDTEEVKICFGELRHTLKESDAMLYAPSSNEVSENCKIMSLRCYMLELIMVSNEEEIYDNNTDCISDFIVRLPAEAETAGCPPCEAYSLKNITIFLDRLNHLLEEMTAIQYQVK